MFRVVLANPLTDQNVLRDVLAEQREIAVSAPVAAQLAKLHTLLVPAATD